MLFATVSGPPLLGEGEPLGLSSSLERGSAGLVTVRDRSRVAADGVACACLAFAVRLATFAAYASVASVAISCFELLLSCF